MMYIILVILHSVSFLHSALSATDTTLPVIIVPQHLNFGNCNLGYVSSKNVSIYNNADVDLILSTVYVTRSVFQPSISRSKTVTLERNQRYELGVMFLPHVNGEVTETFHLFIYLVSESIPKEVVEIKATGTGQDNPFRIKPFVGIKWPTFVAYSPTVNIYNPFSEEIKVEEIYASGGNLHLVPPVNEGNSWSIAPYETKAIVRLNLLSDKSYSHLSYVTLKLSGEENVNLKIPVDVNLISTPDIFTMPNLLNFGSFSRHSPPKTIGLFMLSTHNMTLNIKSAIIANTILNDNGISVKLLREGLHQSHRGIFHKIADVTMYPEKLFEYAEITHNSLEGNVSLAFSNSMIGELLVPFSANFYVGGLNLWGFDDGFYSGDILPKLYVKELKLTNNYDIPVAIKNIDLEPFKSEFLIEDLTLPFVVYPRATFRFARFSLKRQGSKFSKNLLMKMYTNLTESIDFPIPVYNGDIDVFIDEEKLNVLNFELLGYNQTRYKIVKLLNNNPVKVQLLYYFTNVPFCDGYYTNLWRSVEQKLLKQKPEDPIQHQLVELAPNDYIEINVTIKTPSVSHNVSGFFVIETNYDFIQLPLTFRTLSGGLLEAAVSKERVFPGKLNILTLKITNTYNESFPIEDVRLDTNDLFTLHKLKDVPVLLQPLASEDVAKILFHPEKDNKYSYLMSDDSKKQKEYFRGNRLNFDQVDYELKLFKHLRGRWNNLIKNDNHILTIQGGVKSSFSDNSPIELKIPLSWPTFVMSYNPFPVTHIKDVELSHVKIGNPSAHPLHLELFFITSYPHSRALIDILDLRQDTTHLNHEVYSFQKTEDSYLDKILTRGDSSNELKSFVLQPGEKKDIVLQFAPTVQGLHKNVLVLRNNLTLFENIPFSTHAAHAELVFEKKQHLLLNMHENLLSDCHLAEEGTIDRNYFNINKTYNIKNIGDVPADVVDLWINGVSCSAHGITVMNCEPFKVYPLELHPLKFNFVPNFHHSFTEFTLTVVPMSGDNIEIPIVAKVPYHMLDICSDKLERPLWEISFRFLLTTGSFCAVVVVLVQSYIFFSQPVVISPAVKPVIIHKTPDGSPVPAKQDPVPVKKNRKSDRSQIKPSETPTPPLKSKKKNKDSIKAKEYHHVIIPDTGLAKQGISNSPKVSKRRTVPIQKAESPKIEVAVPKPKPEKMTNPVKPRIKETVKESVIIKKQKDINIVKPEPKRVNPVPATTESKYRLSNRLTVAVEPELPVLEPDNQQLEQKFNEAVQEEQKRKTKHKLSSLYRPPPPLPQWNNNNNNNNPVPPKIPTSSLLTATSVFQPLGFETPTSTFDPPRSVDDWFAPNSQMPFTDLNLQLPSSRQTSRFQSMFTEENENENWNGIWGPIRLDEGLDQLSWRTD